MVTVEDGCVMGGMGSAVLEFMSDNGYQANIIRLGIPDKFIEHGSQHDLYKECLFDTENIYLTARKMISKMKSKQAAG